MRRGAISEQQRLLKERISSTIEIRGIPTRLAQRIAFQLVFKFKLSELEDSAVWCAVGDFLREEIERLKTRVGLVDRQIVTVLPKLSACQVEDFLDELRATDRRIARTMLKAALEAAEPLAAGRRYLAEYRSVAEQLKAIDPSVARTLANATFTARIPRKQAMEHYTRFAELMMKFKGNLDFARLVAKAAFRAPDPLKAAEDFIADYSAVVAELTSNGVEPHIARTVASLSRVRDKRKPGG
jgi:hypothetical protein